MVLVGLSHRTACVELRERCAVPPAALSGVLARLRAETGIEECWILSTCNRTEVLALVEDPRESAERIRVALFGAAAATPEAVYGYDGADAVFHVFRVAAGLDSQVLGESQILSQMKEAIAASKDAGALGTVLGSLVEQALALGKRVRTRTRLGEGTLSVARAAVELAQKVLGSFGTVRALVVGVGETGLLVAKHLRDAGCTKLWFANRTVERAQAAAAELGGEALPLDGIGGVLSDVNLTIVSVDAPEPIVLPSHFNPARLRRHDRPPMLIDISVPRAVHPSLKSHPDVLVHDMDDLDAIVARHQQEREAEIEAAGKIVVEEAHKWFALRAYASFKPAIAGLVERFEQIRAELLTQLGGSEADPAVLSE
jgi:glutamyl-tRNA reductase